MRSRDWAWWRPVLGLLLLAVVYVVAAIVVVLLAVAADVAPDPARMDLADPVTLLITNLSLIVAIPVVWLAWVAVHGMGRGWSSSVLGRLRRRLLVPYVLIALRTLGVGVGLSVLIGFVLGDDGTTGPVAGFGGLLVVVVLTTPLQSAAEEYFFRGYLSQCIAGWVRAPRAGAVVAAVLTAALFSAAHLPPDVPTFLDRFAFGLAASAVVWLTGGLEAAIVLHAVNNVLVFVLAGALGDGVDTETYSSGPDPLLLLVSVLSVAAYVAVVARSRARLRPETRTAAMDQRTPGRPQPVHAA
jgi:membrane protease YdiL (CAAX protease family)